MYEIRVAEIHSTTKHLIHTQRFKDNENKNTNQEFQLYSLNLSHNIHKI